MRIAIITPGALGFKSPSVYVAENLRKRGHSVGLLIDSGEKIITGGDFDVVFGDMERSCVSAYLSAVTLNAPCYLHCEWIPEFRVTKTDKWGAGCILPDEQIIQWQSFYKPIASIAHKANICSWASPIFQKFAEEFTGRKYTNCFTRFTRLPSNVPKEPVSIKEAEYAVCICSRLAPIKRVPMLIEAVGKMAIIRKPKIYVVGDGPERLMCLQTAEKHGLDIEFAGATDEEEKWEFIAKSKLMLSAWTGIPPGEALMIGRPTLAYDYEHIRELYDDTLLYTPNNDIEEMSVELGHIFMRGNDWAEEFALKGRERLLNADIGLQTFERGVDEIEQVLENLKEK